jgi:hypothetical protein
VRFNFHLDILYLDISQEENGLCHLFGVLKEIELTYLKYVAIDESYLIDDEVGLDLTTAALTRALRAMTDLEEMIVVRDITSRRRDYYSFPLPARQIKFYTERRIAEAKESWADVENLLDVQEEYKDWKPSDIIMMTPVYRWRLV